jgi:YVTN family beta-propeller protein
MFGNRYIRLKFDRGLLTLLTLLVLSPVNSYAGFLYLLNDDSTGNRIYGFQVNETTGALTALPGFPVTAATGGINNIVSERMAVDPVNRRLYVVNEGSDSVSAYSIDAGTGAITAMPFSPIALGTGVWNTIAVHPSGSPVTIANNSSTSGLVHSFVITSTTATAAAGSPYTVTGAAGFSGEFSRDGNYYYFGGNSGMTIAGYSVNPSTGVLTPLPGSPFNGGATGLIAYAADSAGRLFTVDTVDAIRVFTSSSGVLSPVTGNPFVSGLTQRRFGIVHHNQNFYIVAGNSGNNVGVYGISGKGAATTVAPVAGSPFPTGGTTANALALNQSGTFLFVANRTSRNVTTFAFDPATGILSGQTVQMSNTLGTVGAINGIGYLADPSASNAEIGGRITDVNGNGVGRVVVHLTSMDGMTNLIAITSSFGYYNFPGVSTGVTYTLTPSRKAYSFTPPSITFTHTSDATNQNFMANQD